MSYYVSYIVEIGSEVEGFLSSRLLVLFGESAPQELREISVIHKVSTMVEGSLLLPGRELVLNETGLEVVEVGSMAEKNLRTLGHVVLASEGELLPGQVRVKGKWPEHLDVGDRIEIRD